MLVTLALLIAINVVLARFFGIQTPIVQINFSFIPVVLAALLYGPLPAALVGAVGDVLGAVLFPAGAYFPGFTLTSALGGLIYGLCLYRPSPKRGVRLARCFAAKGLVNLLCNLGLNTLWLTLTGGEAFFALLPLRAVKNLLLWPMESLLLFAVLETVRRVSLQFPDARRVSGRRAGL